MLQDGYSEDQRGISPTIGVVLLVAIVTMAMALIGASVLGVGLLEDQPDADLVYAEDGGGNVTIGVKDATNLQASDTEIRLEGDGTCVDWQGSGSIEEGDTMLVEAGDCPTSLSKGDVIQVISSDTLIDTYELRG